MVQNSIIMVCAQDYLHLKAHQEQVVSLASPMLDTGFPCFRKKEFGWSCDPTFSILIMIVSAPDLGARGSTSF